MSHTETESRLCVVSSEPTQERSKCWRSNRKSRLRLACLCVFDGFNKNANTCINITECYYEMKTQQVEKKRNLQSSQLLKFHFTTCHITDKGSLVCVHSHVRHQFRVLLAFFHKNKST